MKHLFFLLLLSVLIAMPAGAANNLEEVTAGEPLPADLIPATEFYVGTVIRVVDGAEERQGARLVYQDVKVSITSGTLKGQELDIKNGGGTVLPDSQRVKQGESVVIAKTEMLGETDYYIADKYRIPSLAILGVFFLALVILFARGKGLAAFVGLAVGMFILIQFIIPRIVAGENPLFVGFIGAVIIAVCCMYTAHGFAKRTSLALGATLITLGISLILAFFAVWLVKLFGSGTEEAFYLQISPLEDINLKGLLLAGIIIGALGVLDDITTTQTASVDEIYKANNSLSFRELYWRGLSVGKEHIASLVNTLVLAYAGASLPMFLLFSINNTQPWWVLLNTEFISEEIVRTLVGSAALVLAVPIATLLAAYFLRKKSAS